MNVMGSIYPIFFPSIFSGDYKVGDRQIVASPQHVLDASYNKSISIVNLQEERLMDSTTCKYGLPERVY